MPEENTKIDGEERINHLKNSASNETDIQALVHEPKILE